MTQIPQTTTLPLASAVAYIEASEVAPNRFAFKFLDEEHYRLTSAAVITAAFTFDVPEDAESPGPMARATLKVIAQSLPITKWWTPEHRETYRDKRDGSYAPAAWISQGCTPFDALAQHYQRITVDLDTGAEVPV